jgi:hypothetical protein
MAALSENSTRKIRQHVLNTLVQGVRRKRAEEYTHYASSCSEFFMGYHWMLKPLAEIAMDPRSIGKPKDEGDKCSNDRHVFYRPT